MENTGHEEKKRRRAWRILEGTVAEEKEQEKKRLWRRKLMKGKQGQLVKEINYANSNNDKKHRVDQSLFTTFLVGIG